MDALINTESEQETCIVCQKPVRYGTGFAHIKHDRCMVTLCCPLCMETFQKHPAPYVALQAARNLPRTSKPDVLP